MKSRLVSITGASGFLGWHAAEAFRDRGWQVRAIVRPGSIKPLPGGVQRVESALEAKGLVRAIDDSEALVHVAGVTRARSAADLDVVNVEGTRAVVNAANALGVHLLHISSLAAAGTGTATRPRREDDEPRPITPYGWSKLGGERLVRTEARVPWTIIRPPAIYGPRDTGFLPLFRMASRGWLLQVSPPDTAFTMVHVSDVANALVAALERPDAVGETLFVGHPEPVTADSLLSTLAAAVGRPFRPWHVPIPLLRLVASAGDVSWKLGMTPILDGARLAELQSEGFVCAVGRAQRVLGFVAATSLAEGFSTTARWYREHGW